MQVVILRQGDVLKGGFMLWQHINPFDMASTDTIEQVGDTSSFNFFWADECMSLLS